MPRRLDGSVDVLLIGDPARRTTAKALVGDGVTFQWVPTWAVAAAIPSRAILVLDEASWASRPAADVQRPMFCLHGVLCVGHQHFPPPRTNAFTSRSNPILLREAVRLAVVPALVTPPGRSTLSALPWPVGRSLEIVLEEIPPTHEDAIELLARGCQPFPRHRVELAERLGCHPDHLSRLARRSGFRFSNATRQFLILRMWHHRAVTCDAWSVTGTRFGFGSLSALCDFVKRLHGTALRELAARDFEALRDSTFAWLERAMGIGRRAG